MTGKLSRSRTVEPIGVRPLAVACRTSWSKRTHGTPTGERSFLLRHNIELLVVPDAPADTHAELCTAALANGVHVLCEKPLLGTSMKQNACASWQPGDHLAVVDFQLRFTGPVAGSAIRSPRPPLG